MTETKIDTQVIANLVVRNRQGEVLLVRNDPDNSKWWLPGRDVTPFHHPDDTARQVLAGLPGLEVTACTLSHVESFRGRRGWHLVFHYDVRGDGEATSEVPVGWFAADAMPPTMHGQWEKQAVGQVIGTTPR